MNARDREDIPGADQCSPVLTCTVCCRQMRNPHLLPCLHAFCLACLQDECSQRSRDKFFCPVCVDAALLAPSESASNGNSSTTINNPSSKKSVPSKPWHSFDKILENEAAHDALQRRLAELPASECRGNNGSEDDESGSEDGGEHKAGNRRLSQQTTPSLGPPAMFPCSNHSDRLTDQFCTKCEQIACPKCLSSFHRRCSQGSIQNINDALESRRRGFDSLHNTIAGSLALCEEAQAIQTSRAGIVEATRARLLLAVQTVREEMVAAILAKEKALVDEVNSLMDQEKRSAEGKASIADRLAASLSRQLDVMSFSIGAGAEGELLPYLPGLETLAQADARLAVGRLQEAPHSEVLFQRADALDKALAESPLGFLRTVEEETAVVHRRRSVGKPDDGVKTLGLVLTLVTSFHGGARDDITEPLLTDLVLLANGDVILTDRDNHCVKKFNRSGKLLTRVMLDASPVRIAVVSHGRAVVSTTSRRELFYLSLQGTVRVLSSVRVKKLYTFLTSLGGGILAAGTNYGDCLDLITEEGRYLRTIFSGKPDRAGISRPFYVTPVRPAHQQSVQGQSCVHAEAAARDTRPSDSHGNSSVSSGHSDSTSATPDTSSSKHGGSTSSSTNGTSKKSSTYNHNSGSSNTTNPNISRKSSTSISKGKNHINNNSKNLSTSTTTNNINNNNINNHKSGSAGARKSPNTSETSPTSTTTTTSSVPLDAANSNANNISSSTNLHSTDDLWVTDSARKILYRLRQSDGKTTFTLKSRPDLELTLECPLGVTVHPSGLPLLVDRDTDSVLLLDQGGHYIRSVLTAADGLVKPCAIYAGHKCQIALSQVDGMVKIYSSTLQYL